MSEHPNVTVVNRMTQAALDGDQDALAACFSEDLTFRVRGTLLATGDHRVNSPGFDGDSEPWKRRRIHGPAEAPVVETVPT